MTQKMLAMVYLSPKIYVLSTMYYSLLQILKGL